MAEAPFAGKGSFVGDTRNSGAAPPPLEGAGTGMFVLKLSYNGVGIGYFGTDGIWAKVVPTQSAARRLMWYGYSGKDFISDGGNMYMTWSGLSGGPVAVNDWAYACEWKLTDGHLTASNGHQLSRYSSSTDWLYCNNSYNVLRVDVEPV